MKRGARKFFSPTCMVVESFPVVVPDGLRTLFVVDTKIYTFGRPLGVHPTKGGFERLI